MQGLLLDVLGELFVIDCHATPLDGFDLVLGVQWLRTLGPILWDFEHLTMSFWKKDHQVIWHSINMSEGPLQVHSCATDDHMAILLEGFKALFDKLCGLPLVRMCDHAFGSCQERPLLQFAHTVTLSSRRMRLNANVRICSSKVSSGKVTLNFLPW